MLSLLAASSTSLASEAAFGLLWIGQIRNRICRGHYFVQELDFLPASALLKKTTPVRLPSGLLKLLTRPRRIGSSPDMKTIGIVCVASFAACAGAVPPEATITATLRVIKSETSVGNRSYCPSAQRYSTKMLLPSLNPISCRPLTNAATERALGPWDAAWRKPIVKETRSCAETTVGPSTVQLNPASKSRRLIR